MDSTLSEARVNITYGGINSDLVQTVNYDAPDDDIRGWVTEALTTGSIPGFPSYDSVDLTHFVLDRFPATAERPHPLILLRPKTPFGSR